MAEILNNEISINSNMTNLSVAELTEKLILRIRSTTSELMVLWDEVHMDQINRPMRVECAFSSFYGYLEEIIRAERNVVNGVRTEIESRKSAVSELRNQFKMPSFNSSSYPENSIALLKALNKDLTALRQRKEKIIDAQMLVYNKYESLCRKTETPYEKILGIEENFIENYILDEIDEKSNELQEIFDERLEKVQIIQEECLKIQDVLSQHCNLTREEVLFLNKDYTSDDAIISENLIEKFSILEQKMKNQYDVWIEEVAFRYDELLIKMTELSKKCFSVKVDPTKYKMGVQPERLGEKDIQQLEEDVKHMQEMYERGKPVFDKLNQWISIWQEKLDSERRVCRTSFYKNRGGQLSASLKRQKQICQQVPKVFNELKETVSDYVKQYKAEDILIEGMLPHKYAEFMMEEYQRDKEQFAKKTNGKENLGKSVFKISHEIASPGSALLASRKRSFSCSQISMILPTKPPLPCGVPITSSPKVRRLSPTTSNCSNEPRTPRAFTPTKNSLKVSSSAKRPLANSTRVVTPSRPWY